jgi:haloalkane dehalogenase
VPSIESQAVIVEQLLKTLQLQSVYLVMQEIGGHSVMSVFLKYPQWLKGIILTDTIIFPVSQYPKISRMLSIVDSGIFNFFNSNFNVLIRMLTTSGVKKRKMNHEEKNTYKAMFNDKTARRISTAMLHQLKENDILLSMIQKAFETNLNNTPALLIYGDEDSLTHLGIPQRIHQLLPGSDLRWIHGEKHFPHEGAPDEMSQIISSWIKSHRAVEV